MTVRFGSYQSAATIAATSALAWAMLSVAPARGAPVAGNSDIEDRYVEITPDTEAAVDNGLKFLAATQRTDGSWRGRQGRNTGICSFAVLGFLSAGHLPERGPYGRIVARGIDYVMSCAQLSGLIVQPQDSSNGPMYEHAMSTLMLAEVWGAYDRPGVLDRLQRAVNLIIATQGDQGGWRYLPQPADADISVTVMQLVALRAAASAGITVPKRVIDMATNYVRSCALPEGGFAYMPGTGGPGYGRTGAGVCSLEVGGDYDSPEVLAGIRYLQANKNAEDRDRAHYLYGLYYAAQGMYQAAEPKQWERWFPVIRDELLKAQHADGHWDGEAGETYGTSMAILVLSVPYRYLPIYQR